MLALVLAIAAVDAGTSLNPEALARPVQVVSDKLEILATNELGDTMNASPVLVGHQLFLRGENTLYCITEGGTAATVRSKRASQP